MFSAFIMPLIVKITTGRENFDRKNMSRLFDSCRMKKVRLRKNVGIIKRLTEKILLDIKYQSNNFLKTKKYFSHVLNTTCFF